MMKERRWGRERKRERKRKRYFDECMNDDKEGVGKV